ncbi:MAG: HAD-IIIA family hydrolase [Crocinitomicaceae bacterium]|nr:HAD-IIIA family hydrolase [Crocinitomicaceae bacterium]
MIFPEVNQDWTLFLDRDGVINVRKMGGYIENIEQFEFLPEAKEAIAAFSKIFKYVFVVTNQQGISKGIMTESNLFDIHRYMTNEIELAGGKIDACYHAPGLKATDVTRRKPFPGMALEAKENFPTVDFRKSIMVGDTDSDIQFGKNLGMKTIRIKTLEPIGIEADATVNNLKEILG